MTTTTKTPSRKAKTTPSPKNPLIVKTILGQIPLDRGPTKLALIVALLSRPEGASLTELVVSTGWQAHSVRGALAGSLKKKGYVIVREIVDGERRYRIGAAR